MCLNRYENFLNFSIGSSYPDYYTLWINGTIVVSGNYASGEMIQYSLDNYTSTLGNYSVYIWAIGLDGKIGEIYAEFNVYSTSSTIISIVMLNDLEFLSKNNNLIFTIHSDYPDYYELWIDDTGKCGNGTWAEIASNPWCTDVNGDGSLYPIQGGAG